MFKTGRLLRFIVFCLLSFNFSPVTFSGQWKIILNDLYFRLLFLNVYFFCYNYLKVKIKHLKINPFILPLIFGETSHSINIFFPSFYVVLLNKISKIRQNSLIKRRLSSCSIVEKTRVKLILFDKLYLCISYIIEIHFSISKFPKEKERLLLLKTK